MLLFKIYQSKLLNVALGAQGNSKTLNDCKFILNHSILRFKQGVVCQTSLEAFVHLEHKPRLPPLDAVSSRAKAKG